MKSKNFKNKSIDERQSFSETELNTKENGISQPTKEKAKEYKYGQTEVNMKAIGKMIKPMAKEDSSMQTVMYTKVNGQTIKVMALEYTTITMEPSIEETG